MAKQRADVIFIVLKLPDKPRQPLQTFLNLQNHLKDLGKQKWKDSSPLVYVLYEDKECLEGPKGNVCKRCTIA